jgi:hypothetical protein
MRDDSDLVLSAKGLKLILRFPPSGGSGDEG